MTLAASHPENRVHVSPLGLSDTTEATINKAFSRRHHQEGYGLELLPCKEGERTELFWPREKEKGAALGQAGHDRNSTDRLFTAMPGGRVF